MFFYLNACVEMDIPMYIVQTYYLCFIISSVLFMYLFHLFIFIFFILFVPDFMLYKYSNDVSPDGDYTPESQKSEDKLKLLGNIQTYRLVIFDLVIFNFNIF